MTRRRFPRVAGSRWRLLVHGVGVDRAGAKIVGRSYDVTSDPEAPAEHAKRKAWFVEKGKPDAYAGEDPIVLESTEFDEFVLGAAAVHIEQMDTGKWWMSVGGFHLTVHIDRDGCATRVTGELADPRDGVVYAVEAS